MRLINQLLDLSALDSGFMKLQVSRNNIVRFASNITDTFAHLAEHSEIRLSFSSNVPEASVYFDPDKVEKILYNLISNAIKFTERNGSVTVALHVFSPGEVAMPEVFGQKATPGGEFVHIVVSDSGVGIRDRDREKIFERFYQCTHEKQGTGIGLALTRQLVDRHQGIITVESEPGKGSIFSVWLPVSENQFAPDQIVQSVSPSQSWDRVRLPESADMSSTADRMHHDKADAPVILLVEDNGDVRSFLRVNLSDQYNIHEAAGGNEGLVKALDLNPDLIISDIVMSEGDGYTLCKNIKSDHRTSHIPVLLLTARTSDHFQLEGFQYGAEDYIIKPFNPSILKARIQSLLQARQKLKDKFYADLSFDPVNIAANVLDKSFVSQLLANIESNLKNEDFNPDLLATNLNISRSQLYKKVKGLTGLSVSIFVRNIRLRKAAQLLKANALPVSQAAYEVGFSDPGYFTKCFRELYGKSPSEFIKHPVDV
jgi:DNA-binding response OmpR family regulator/two-component sensor histidine kinase